MIDILTVSPLNTDGLSDKDHYQSLFDRLGVSYCFADESDPNLAEKIRRGKTDIDTVIPRLSVDSTTDRVTRLFGEESEQHISVYPRMRAEAVDFLLILPLSMSISGGLADLVER